MIELPVEALTLLLQLVIRLTKLSDSLLSKQLLKGPLLDVLRLIFLQLLDEGNGTLQNGALVFLAPRDNLSELVNALVNCLATATLNCRLC